MSCIIFLYKKQEENVVVNLPEENAWGVFTFSFFFLFFFNNEYIAHERLCSSNVKADQDCIKCIGSLPS